MRQRVDGTKSTLASTPCSAPQPTPAELAVVSLGALNSQCDACMLVATKEAKARERAPASCGRSTTSEAETPVKGLYSARRVHCEELWTTRGEVKQQRTKGEGESEGTREKERGKERDESPTRRPSPRRL